MQINFLCKLLYYKENYLFNLYVLVFVSEVYINSIIIIILFGKLYSRYKWMQIIYYIKVYRMIRIIIRDKFYVFVGEKVLGGFAIFKVEV